MNARSLVGPVLAAVALAAAACGGVASETEPATATDTRASVPDGDAPPASIETTPPTTAQPSEAPAPAPAPLPPALAVDDSRAIALGSLVRRGPRARRIAPRAQRPAVATLPGAQAQDPPPEWPFPASAAQTVDERFSTHVVAASGTALVPRPFAIRQTDHQTHIDTLLATATATNVALQPIPGANRFVVAVQWDTEHASVFVLDADAISARRIHDGPGILTEARVSPDGRDVAFFLRPYHAGRSRPPPREEPENLAPGRRMPACDPVGSMCGEPGVCGYLPDHCGGYFDCGPCPDELPPAPGPRHGLFVARLASR